MADRSSTHSGLACSSAEWFRSTIRALTDEVALPIREAELATAAVRQLLMSPADRWDSLPLVLVVGPAATGKTLTVSSLVAQHLAFHPGFRWLWTSAVALASDLQRAAQNDQLQAALDELLSFDLVIAEDLHELRGSALSQRWAPVLSLLQQQTTRLIVTSRLAPGEIGDLPPRVAGRLRGGVMTSLRFPGLESRLQLAAHFAQTAGRPLDMSVLGPIARNFPGSPARLKQAVRDAAEALPSAASGSEVTNPGIAISGATAGRSRIDSNTGACGPETTDPRTVASGGVVATTGLATGAQPTNGKRGGKVALAASPLAESQLSILGELVAAEFGLAASQLTGRARGQTVIIARQCAMTLARRFTPCSLESIGAFFGQRNHTTVSYSCRQFDLRLDKSPLLQEQVQRIIERLPQDLRHDVA